MLTRYNIDGKSIYDSPVMQSGVMVVMGNDNEVYKLKQTSSVLLYKKVTKPGEQEQWVFLMMLVNYGRSLKETAVRALGEFTNFHINEEMLNEATGMFKSPFIDDTHTGPEFYYSPISFLYTYMIDTNKEYDYLKTLYHTLSVGDFNSEIESVRSRAEYINERYIISKSVYNYIYNKEHKDINKINRNDLVEKVDWFSPRHVTELCDKGKMDKSSAWLWYQIVRKMRFEHFKVQK